MQAVEPEEAVTPPPYVSEMSVAHKEEGLVYRFIGLFRCVCVWWWWGGGVVGGADWCTSFWGS